MKFSHPVDEESRPWSLDICVIILVRAGNDPSLLATPRDDVRVSRCSPQGRTSGLLLLYTHSTSNRDTEGMARVVSRHAYCFLCISEAKKVAGLLLLALL